MVPGQKSGKEGDGRVFRSAYLNAGRRGQAKFIIKYYVPKSPILQNDSPNEPVVPVRQQASPAACLAVHSSNWQIAQEHVDGSG